MVAKVETPNPDRTISPEGCSAYVEKKKVHPGTDHEDPERK
jgi:hypothetical protein